MNTVFMLLAEFSQAHIPLDAICEKYFGMQRPEAYRAAKNQLLPVPTFRAGSNKSGWLVDVNDLAAYVDKVAAKARDDHRKMHAA